MPSLTRISPAVTEPSFAVTVHGSELTTLQDIQAVWKTDNGDLPLTVLRAEPINDSSVVLHLALLTNRLCESDRILSDTDVLEITIDGASVTLPANPNPPPPDDDPIDGDDQGRYAQTTRGVPFVSRTLPLINFRPSRNIQIVLDGDELRGLESTRFSAKWMRGGGSVTCTVRNVRDYGPIDTAIVVQLQLPARGPVGKESDTDQIEISIDSVPVVTVPS